MLAAAATFTRNLDSTILRSLRLTIGTLVEMTKSVVFGQKVPRTTCLLRARRVSSAFDFIPLSC